MNIAQIQSEISQAIARKDYAEADRLEAILNDWLEWVNNH